MRKFKDMTGFKHGKLTATSPAGRHSNGKTQWNCVCECGNSVVVETRLLSGEVGVRSCGCTRIEKNRQRPVRNSTNLVHGESGTKSARRSPEYICWISMRQRCMDKNHSGYKDYGARGISICEEWSKSFDAFVRDMGRKPSNNHSIDRIDTNGNYSKENCRWVEWKEQSLNKRTTVKVALGGELVTCERISEIYGVPVRTIYRWAREHGSNLGSVIDHLVSRRTKRSI